MQMDLRKPQQGPPSVPRLTTALSQVELFHQHGGKVHVHRTVSDRAIHVNGLVSKSRPRATTLSFLIQ